MHIWHEHRREMCIRDRSLVYLYDYHADSSTPQTLSGRTLLYQTPDNISEISMTPDDRHIILKTQEATVRNACLLYTSTWTAFQRLQSDAQRRVKQVQISQTIRFKKLCVTLDGSQGGFQFMRCV